MVEVKIAAPKDYFQKFDPAVQRQATDLLDTLLADFPGLQLVVKYNSPFFQLKGNGWSVCELIYDRQGFKIGFVNDAALAFYDSHQHPELEGSKALHFDPADAKAMSLVRQLLTEAILIQEKRPAS